MYRFKDIKVMLIDDDEEDYILTRELLREVHGRNYELDWVATYEEGVRSVRENKHDIFLVDYRLGVKTGLELLSEMGAENLKFPMILLTGQGATEIDEEALRLGASDYLIKGEMTPSILDRSIRYTLKNFQILEQVRHLHEQSEQVVRERTAELAETVTELKESQNFLVTMAHNFPNGTISAIDKDWNYVFAEGLGYKMLGIHSEDLIGQNLKSRITPEEFEVIHEPILKAFQGHTGKYEFRRSGRDFLTYTVPLPNADNTIDRVMLVNQDITERKQAEEDITNALKKERQLNELKSRFVSMASHEFRTPLATILSSVTLISKYNGPEDEPKRLKHVERIKSSITHMTQTLEDFLSLGKLEEGLVTKKPDTFNVVELCEEIKEEIQATTKMGQELVYKHFGVGAEIYLDKMLLRNILFNLLSNAVKYSSENDAIELETIRKDEELTINVTDHGIGIPEDDQKFIFNLFFRAHNSTNIQGTGLGLNIVKKYIDLLNGSISFTSEVGRGTTFTISIPLSISKYEEDSAHRG